MIICVCRAVNDQKIRALVAGGAKDINHIRRACHAGSDCGMCVAEIKKLIEESENQGHTGSMQPHWTLKD